MAAGRLLLSLDLSGMGGSDGAKSRRWRRLIQQFCWTKVCSKYRAKGKALLQRRGARGATL